MAPKHTKQKAMSAPNLSKQFYRASMGNTPASLLHRTQDKKDSMCPPVNLEFDPYCDPSNPKTITYKDIRKALEGISETIPKSPLRQSNHSEDFGVQLYYKMELFNTTRSFNERGALNALLSLTPDQRLPGVICASLGNFGLALAYHARRLGILARIVFPENTPALFPDKCKEYGVTVIMSGANLTEARRKALHLAYEWEVTFINGYDHPAVIAGSGTLGMEIIEDLPEVNAILVPIGGGGLIAGVAEAVKHANPDVLIYGVEPVKCCCFFKAMENDEEFETEVGDGVAAMLGVPTAGTNAFHTAKSMISKLVLVDDDWIARAVNHMAEEERLVVEGAGATALGALFAMPDLMPELKNKTVVCILTGSNISHVMQIPRCMERTRAIDGRLIKLTMNMNADDTAYRCHVMSMISNVGCNVIQSHVEPAWITHNDLWRIKLHLIVETRDIQHACHLKRVMTKLFPNDCDFMEEPFSPVPVCVCYPKKKAPFDP
ncbi:pyridoxal-phosphate dependent enzyme domain-containing protein [Phthorimaea operculella]|nr:pyridoxal-phosphate dependent enzyme domain-containing protein [Phthorimaea operculella]